MNIVILASGNGTRFKMAGYDTPKMLLPVTNEKVVLDYIIENFDESDNYIVIVNPDNKSMIEEYLSRLKPKICYHIICYEGEKYGPAYVLYKSLTQIEKLIDDSGIMVSYCDFGFSFDYNKFKYLLKSSPNAVMLYYQGIYSHLRNPNNVYAAVRNKILEKYHSDDRYNEKWSPGLYYFKNLNIISNALEIQLQDNDDKINNEWYVSTTFNYLEEYEIFKIDNFYQFGTPLDYEFAKLKLNMVYNNNYNGKTIILASGKGERFFKSNYKIPKPFLPIGKSTLIQIIINSLNKSNIICSASVNHKNYWDSMNMMPRYVENNSLGAAYSFKCISDNEDDNVLVVPCDLIAKYNITHSIIVFAVEASEYQKNNPDSFSWVTLNKSGFLNEIGIKKYLSNGFVLIGSFYINERLLNKYIDKLLSNEDNKVNNEYYLDSVFKLLKNDGFDIKIEIINDYLSFGTPDEYEENKKWINNIFL